jgi:copper chaperone CopZ
MKNAMRPVLFVLSLASFALLGSSSGTAVYADASTQYLVGIEGMSCPHNCAPKVKESLEKIDGVRSVTVDFEHKQATVEMAPGKALSREACDKAFGNSGYFVSSFTEQAEPAPGI